MWEKKKDSGISDDASKYIKLSEELRVFFKFEIVKNLFIPHSDKKKQI